MIDSCLESIIRKEITEYYIKCFLAYTLCDDLLTDATTNTFHPNQTGNYYVVVIENGCQSAPSNSIFINLAEISEYKSNALNINIYPNPFTEKTTITYTLLENENIELKIVDITGKELINPFTQHQSKGNQSIEIDASKLSSGFYFYILKAGNTLQKGKLIIY